MCLLQEAAKRAKQKRVKRIKCDGCGALLADNSVIIDVNYLNLVLSFSISLSFSVSLYLCISVSLFL